MSIQEDVNKKRTDKILFLSIETPVQDLGKGRMKKY